MLFYYCENVLERGLLPAICRISNNDFVIQQDGAPCTPFTRHHRLPAFQCARVYWTRKLVAKHSRSKSCELCSVESIVADGITSQNFRHWSAEATSDCLLGSAKPGHTELSNWSAGKKTDDGYQGKGWSCWISSGLTLSVSNCPCFIVYRMKIEQKSLSNSMQFWGYWWFMQIRQRIFNWWPVNYAFRSRQNSETLYVLNTFLSLVVCKVIWFQKGFGFFGPPCICHYCVITCTRWVIKTCHVTEVNVENGCKVEICQIVDTCSSLILTLINYTVTACDTNKMMWGADGRHDMWLSCVAACDTNKMMWCADGRHDMWLSCKIISSIVVFWL